MPRILLADDHPIVRAGMRGVLAAGVEGAQFGDASDFREALRLVRESAWDLVVLDVSMPGGTVIEAIRAVKAHDARLPVLVVSMFGEEQYAIRVLKAGASGYLMKGSVGGEIVAAVRRLLSGRRYISPALAERLAGVVGGEVESEGHEALSDREYEVLVGLANGRSVSELAEDLALSVKTVSTYRTRLLAKLGMETNAELIRYGIQSGLVE